MALQINEEKFRTIEEKIAQIEAGTFDTENPNHQVPKHYYIMMKGVIEKVREAQQNGE